MGKIGKKCGRLKCNLLLRMTRIKFRYFLLQNNNDEGKFINPINVLKKTLSPSEKARILQMSNILYSSPATLIWIVRVLRANKEEFYENIKASFDYSILKVSGTIRALKTFLIQKNINDVIGIKENIDLINAL